MSDLTAEQWNAAHPIGTPVTAYPGIRPEYAAEIGSTDVPRLDTYTRSPAWMLGPEPVVAVEGYAGGISLEHIDLRTEEDEPMNQPQPLDLAAIQARIPAHYPAPWAVELNDDGSWNVVYPSTNPLAGHVAHVPDYGAVLAEFIAAARTDVEQLLARVRELEAERALYVGKEPTIAEEMAELNRRLDAVDTVLTQWNEHCLGTQTRFLLDDVRAALDGHPAT